MRALLLLLAALSSSSCVMLLAPGLGAVLGASARGQYQREGREREAAYRAQVAREAAVARRSYNQEVRDVPEVGALSLPRPTLSAPPLLSAEPPRTPLRAAQ